MKVQITNGMFMALIINMVYAKAIGMTQGIMAREAGSDMWISTMFATLQGCAMMFLTVLIIRRSPELDYMEQTQVMLGKWAGKLVALVLFVFFAGAYSSIMITYVYHLMDYFLPEVPILVFILIALFIGGYGIVFGIEVIGRMALVGVFFILVLNILILAGSLLEFDVQELLPVLESGFWNTVWTSRHNDTDWAMATLMAAMILPTVKNKKTWANSSVAGIAMGGLMVLQWPILETAVLSPEVTAQYIVACMQLARSAHIGMFIHRYEMIMIAFFAISILVQISMCLFCACHSAAKIFGLQDYRPMIIPVGIVLSGLGYWVVLDHNRAMDLLENTWVAIALPIAFGLPLLLWALGFLFEKKLLQVSSTNNEKG
ncbi:GerAB/ArcD/ProY family transporter [Ammoniphilus sp. CFH 90114]|uniref:GerAB/ArcD/ProY family transporter n=1 Tax=Ammoniphilus sp. CFH 90114 TaxID=2493665 RepID=UPI00100F5AE3|nr:GerAB/ArcD/ProY family transporter [Ammoniphilus sp. CFH 90114]RXT06944.1 spore gernimation protein [Ammoniphilus sp. CFH 90114]